MGPNVLRFGRVVFWLGAVAWAVQGTDVYGGGGVDCWEVFVRHRDHLYPGGVRLLWHCCLRPLEGVVQREIVLTTPKHI